MDERTFRTDDGRPVVAVTAEEMRAVDRVAMEDFDIDVLQMIEHAGRAFASTVRTRYGGDVIVLAGNGGNGGGALCAARHLVNRDVSVRVVLDRTPDELDGPAARHERTLDRMGIPIEWGTESLDRAVPDCIVDGLIGYGLSGPARGGARDLIDAVVGVDAPVVSHDVPSGLDATTGERPDEAIYPTHVLTLALPKTGLRSVDAPIGLTDVGIPAGVFEVLGIPSTSPFVDEYVVGIRRRDERRRPTRRRVLVTPIDGLGTTIGQS